MGLRHRHVRLLWVAVMALMGIVSSAQEAWAGPVGPERAAAMLRAGCCCVTARADCCCEGGTPVHVTPPPTGYGAGGLLAAAPGHDPGTRSGSCQCRAADPARTPPDSSSRSEDERSRADHAAAVVGLYIAYAPSVPSSPPTWPHASPPKAPLYLRTARLLI